MCSCAFYLLLDLDFGVRVNYISKLFLKTPLFSRWLFFDLSSNAPVTPNRLFFKNKKKETKTKKEETIWYSSLLPIWTLSSLSLFTLNTLHTFTDVKIYSLIVNHNRYFNHKLFFSIKNTNTRKTFFVTISCTKCYCFLLVALHSSSWKDGAEFCDV